MIARIFIPILLAIIVPDLYFDVHYLRYRPHFTWWRRLLWWMPSIFLFIYTIVLVSTCNFVPDDLTWLNIYLLLVGLIAIPKALIAFCSFLGQVYCRLRHTHVNRGIRVGFILSLGALYVLIYGSTVGVWKLKVKHVDIYSRDLPVHFDGYRIVHFSDAHTGTFSGKRAPILARDVDSINAQHADMIVFTGDLQNMEPREIYPHIPVLTRLKAPDGVYAILGNHDYSLYIKANPAIGMANERETANYERQLGWTLLRNEHRAVYRGQDSIIIAGEENDGRKPFPMKADLSKTLRGVSASAYIVMLQHDQSAWRRHILPGSSTQLTLSGHTHGGQFSLFGLRPTQLAYREDNGLYLDGDRALMVSPGIGGVVPFRFGLSPEIEVITLHQLK